MDSTWLLLDEIKYEEPVTIENFWKAVNVWIERPHLLNRRLLAAEFVKAFTISCYNRENLNHNILKLFKLQSLDIESLHDILKSDSVSEVAELKAATFLEKLISTNFCEENYNILLIRNLLSRNMKIYEDVKELCIFDKSNCSVTFYPMKMEILLYPLNPTFPYRIKLNSDRIVLEICPSNTQKHQPEEDKSKKWLSSEILPKIYKWCNHHPEGPVIPSINLLPAKNYNINLHYLKEKYGKFYVEIWPKFNNTDPLKYVYEDISICAYLITLWEEERAKSNLKQKQTFVDLACGNGLLVDILTSEGYSGVGIDLRKRKIWDAFNCKDKLLEMTIEPSNHQLFPEYDWIIGNHPDELTPWIPFIGARSNYKMKIFLMPCCYYTFSGKYSRIDTGLTRYQSYLKFVEYLCKIAGFNVLQDKLRIPSTKRTCFVCMSRSYDEEDETAIDLQRSQAIRSELISVQASPAKLQKLSVVNNNKQNNSFLKISNESEYTEKWLSDFKPREQKEPVQNCTFLDRKIINDILMKVTEVLLSEENIKFIEREDKIISWNAGGASTLGELVKSLSQNMIVSLKKQNGGFQTLLRNHKNIFNVYKGSVQLRIPVKCSCSNACEKCSCTCQKSNITAYKTKLCFFHFNHPHGCPLSSSDCTFSHEKISNILKL